MIRLLPLLFFLSTVFSSQTTVNQDSTYYLITTNNDTTEITWYRISHYFSYYFCEYKTVDKEYKSVPELGKYTNNVDIDEFLRIENSSGFILYPEGEFKTIEEYTQSQTKPIQIKKPIQKKSSYYKGWRIIGGINLNQTKKEKFPSQICLDDYDYYSIPHIHDYHYNPSSKAYKGVRLGFEILVWNFVLGLTYGQGGINFEGNSPNDSMILYFDNITCHTLLKVNVFRNFALLGGIKYSRVINGLLSYNSPHNIGFKRGVRGGQGGMVLGIDYLINNKFGLRFSVTQGTMSYRIRNSNEFLEPFIFVNNQLSLFYQF